MYTWKAETTFHYCGGGGVKSSFKLVWRDSIPHGCFIPKLNLKSFKIMYSGEGEGEILGEYLLANIFTLHITLFAYNQPACRHT